MSADDALQLLRAYGPWLALGGVFLLLFIRRRRCADSACERPQAERDAGVAELRETLDVLRAERASLVRRVDELGAGAPNRAAPGGAGGRPRAAPHTS